MVDVSTISYSSPPQNDVDRCGQLRQFLHGMGNARHLLQPERLAIRLNVLDALDTFIGDQDLELLKTCPDPEIIERAKSLKCQFEAANEILYTAARCEIASRGNSSTLRRWLAEQAGAGDARSHSGLSFDLLDEIVAGVLRFDGPEEADLLQSLEMTRYQPTPARHIVDLIAACEFTPEDTLVDLGSGLGHVPLLVSILTGIHTVGVEVQPGYVASALEVAHSLNLSRVQFVAEDARFTDLSGGAVFYLFSPFTGSMLREVLRRLYEESKKRHIRICSLGPCKHTLHRQSWLAANHRPKTGQLAVFESHEWHVGAKR